MRTGERIKVDEYMRLVNQIKYTSHPFTDSLSSAPTCRTALSGQPSSPSSVIMLPPPLPTRAATVPVPMQSRSETDVSRDQDSLLTPLRAHYLKKSLIQLQFSREMHAIATSASGASTLSYLGPPFSPPPRHAPRLDLPFLRYVFRQYVLTFPFMAAAPKNFYSEKLQPFLASALARNLSSSVLDDVLDDSEQETHLKLLAKMERNFALFLGSATKLVEREEVVRLSQRDLDRLEMLAKKRQLKQAKVKDVFDVNIVSVRTVTDKKRMRSKVHEVGTAVNITLSRP